MIGQTIGQYKVIEKLGAGGMGEVYLALHTKLDRKDALKFLPHYLTDDPEFRSRLEHEAKAAAALKHPNIVTVYDLGEYEGRLFIAMEYVEGESLEALIKRGDVTLQRAVEIIRQVCEGLQEVHEAGIVHRDIKPSNILIDTKGRARILDFGLAKSRRATAQTKTGTTLGTLQYESPEQVSGEPVDARSDLFSLGAVLYELITGRTPFAGEFEEAIRYSIVHDEPEPLARYKSGELDELQRIVGRALAKDPSVRYQSAADLLAELRQVGPSSRPVQKRQVGIGSRVIVIGGLVIAFVAAAYFLATSNSDRNTAPPRRRQVTFVGDVHAGALSPDGKFLAFVRGEYGGIAKPRTADSMGLYVMELDGGQPIHVFTDWWINGVWWSPDGRELLVRADNEEHGGFYVMPKWGGSSRLYSCGCLGTWWSVSWSPDADRFVAVSDCLSKSYLVVDRLASKCTTVTVQGDLKAIRYTAWSPFGEDVLLVGGGAGRFHTFATRATGGPLTAIYNGFMGSPAWEPNGESIRYLRFHGDLADWVSQKIDIEHYALKGEPVLLAADIAGSSNVGSDASATALGYVRTVGWSNLAVIGLDELGRPASTPRLLTTGTATHFAPSLSPDGKSVAYVKEVDGESQVFVLHIESGVSRRVSNTGSANGSPVWSPGGDQLAYVTFDRGAARLAVVDELGGNPTIYDSCLAGPGGLVSCIGWTSDRSVLYVRPDMQSLESVDLSTGTRLRVGPVDSVGWRFCPLGAPGDDRFVFYWNRNDEAASGFQSKSPNDAGTWISTPEGEDARRLSEMSFPVGWSSDGEWVYVWVFDGRYLARVSVVTGATDSLGTFPDAPRFGISVAPAGNRLVYTVSQSTSDVWLVEHIPQP